MIHKTTIEAMTRSDFNGAVIDELRDRGRDAVANMSEDFDGGMACMSSATVARDESLPLTEDSVPEVADLREYWFENHEQDPDYYKDD